MKNLYNSEFILAGHAHVSNCELQSKSGIHFLLANLRRNNLSCYLSPKPFYNLFAYAFFNN